MTFEKAGGLEGGDCPSLRGLDSSEREREKDRRVH